MSPPPELRTEYEIQLTLGYVCNTENSIKNNAEKSNHGKEKNVKSRRGNSNGLPIFERMFHFFNNQEMQINQE